VPYEFCIIIIFVSYALISFHVQFIAIRQSAFILHSIFYYVRS